jgi:hypothetical protein
VYLGRLSFPRLPNASVEPFSTFYSVPSHRLIFSCQLYTAPCFAYLPRPIFLNATRCTRPHHLTTRGATLFKPFSSTGTLVSLIAFSANLRHTSHTSLRVQRRAVGVYEPRVFRSLVMALLAHFISITSALPDLEQACSGWHRVCGEAVCWPHDPQGPLESLPVPCL